MSDIMQQRGHHQRLQTADLDPVQSAVSLALQERTQCAQGEMVAAQTVLVTRMGRTGPDAIHETKLLYLLEAQKFGRIYQFFFARTKRDQVIQTITHRAHGSLVR